MNCVILISNSPLIIINLATENIHLHPGETAKKKSQQGKIASAGKGKRVIIRASLEVQNGQERNISGEDRIAVEGVEG